jgi:hypothetical protein
MSEPKVVKIALRLAIYMTWISNLVTALINLTVTLPDANASKIQIMVRFDLYQILLKP